MKVERESDLIDPQCYRAVGRKTGLIHTFHYQTPPRGFPVSYKVYPMRSDIEYPVDTDSELDLAIVGKGSSLSESLMSCVGEGLERYAMTIPDEGSMRRATYDDLEASETVVDFEYLDIYGENRLGPEFEPFSQETELLWTPGTNLLTGETVFVPAPLVWYQVDRLQSEPPSLPSTSTGVAAGPSLVEAVLWGLFESIERDGLMRAWLLQQSPSTIAADSLPGLGAFGDEAVPHDDLTVHFLDCPSPVDVPTVGSALVDERDEYPKFLLTGSAGLDPVEALKDAVAEANQTWSYLYHLACRNGLEAVDSSEISDLDRNMYYYAQPGNFDDVSFLLDGVPAESIGADYPDVEEWPVERQLAYTLDRLEDANCTPIVFDLTTPDVRETGVRVVRTFVPELVPLSIPNAAPVDHPAFEDETLTDKPHPFG